MVISVLHVHALCACVYIYTGTYMKHTHVTDPHTHACIRVCTQRTTAGCRSRGWLYGWTVHSAVSLCIFHFVGNATAKQHLSSVLREGITDAVEPW